MSLALLRPERLETPIVEDQELDAWPGTARSAASAGRWLIMISGEMKVLLRARSRHPQHPPGTQAGCQLAAQRATTLNEQSLIDGFMADAHALIVREVDRQAASNLLRAPGVCPPSILPRSMPAAFPAHSR